MGIMSNRTTIKTLIWIPEPVLAVELAIAGLFDYFIEHSGGCGMLHIRIQLLRCLDPI